VRARILLPLQHGARLGYGHAAGLKQTRRKVASRQQTGIVTGISLARIPSGLRACLRACVLGSVDVTTLPFR
jgi:hypothetical protein